MTCDSNCRLQQQRPSWKLWHDVQGHYMKKKVLVNQLFCLPQQRNQSITQSPPQMQSAMQLRATLMNKQLDVQTFLQRHLIRASQDDDTSGNVQWGVPPASHLIYRHLLGYGKFITVTKMSTLVCCSPSMLDRSSLRRGYRFNRFSLLCKQLSACLVDAHFGTGAVIQKNNESLQLSQAFKME